GAEIDERLLPLLHESPAVCAKISSKGAAETGLRVGTPVVAGAGDQAAGATGMGIVAAGTVSATIGTSGVVFAATDRPALDPRGRMHTFCHAIPGRWHVMGVTQAAGLSLRWFRDNFTLFQEMDVPVTNIRLGGGGARSPLWRQIQADIYGRAVEIVEADEGAAYGAAILAGVGAGMWSSVDAACHAVVRVASRVNPQPASVATLNASYSAFRLIYLATR